MASDVGKQIERLEWLRKRNHTLYSLACRLRDALVRPGEEHFDVQQIPPFPDVLQNVLRLIDELNSDGDEIENEIRRLKGQV